MSKTLYTVINPVVKFILSSPLHGWMSRNTILLEFQGRKSGKAYTMPVSYYEKNRVLRCVTDKSNLWWRNLEGGQDIQVTWQGQKLQGTPSVLADGSPEIASALNELLLASPRDASHAGVALDPEGRPNPSDVTEASTSLVLISVDVGQPR